MRETVADAFRFMAGLQMEKSVDKTGRRGVVERADYLIDRFRVAYEFGGGWTCGCADFQASDACRHTREAAGRYAAQAQIAEHIKQGSHGTLGFDDRTLPHRRQTRVA